MNRRAVELVNDDPRVRRLSAPARAALWAALLVVAAVGFTTVARGWTLHTDFAQNVWLPARLVWQGVEPYNPSRAAVEAALGPYAADFQAFNSGADFHFIYPVWVALALSPFAALPLDVATALWRSLNAVLLVWAMWTALRASSVEFRSGRRLAVAVAGITLVLGLIYRPGFLNIYIGQFGIVELALVVAVWAWLARSGAMAGRAQLVGDCLSGLALAALATKPQSVGLAVVLVAAWAVMKRRWAIPVVGAVSLGALMLAPLAVLPGSLAGWLDVTFGQGQAVSQVAVSASVWGLSAQLLGSGAASTAVALVLSLAGLALLAPHWRRDLTGLASALPLSLPLTLCVNSLVSPYMLGYEHVLLLMPAMVLLAAVGLPERKLEAGVARGAKLWRYALYGWLALIPWLVVAVQAMTDKEYPAIAQSATLLALCMVARLKWQGIDEAA